MESSKMNIDNRPDLRQVPEDNAVDNLIIRVEAEVRKNRRKAMVWISILVVLALTYISARISGEKVFNTGMLLTASGFIMGAFYLFIRYRPINSSAYSLPITSFLDKAEKWFSFMRLTDWLVQIPIMILLGTGGGMVLVSRLSHYTDNTRLVIIIWIIFFIALLVFSYIVSGKKYSQEHSDLLKQIRGLKDQFKEN